MFSSIPDSFCCLTSSAWQVHDHNRFAFWWLQLLSGLGTAAASSNSVAIL